MSIYSTPLRAWRSVYGALRYLGTRPYFGFVQGHVHLRERELQRIRASVGDSAPQAVDEFERSFAALIGDGGAVSFAAGRMGFFALMRELGIGAGDEVVLSAATCSVMANAVLRCGARPVYADVDPETYGSDAAAVERVISSRTRMIVAQHSFGIPCRIEPIVELARLRGIFLLEDCALTLGSSRRGIVVGNFGDAALFSTDHSKPLNTMIGGLIYTRDGGLLASLRRRRDEGGELCLEKQRALFARMLLEREYCHPGGYGRMALREYASRLRFRSVRPFLDEDFGPGPGSGYPYPARLPGFLALLGVYEAERWGQVVRERRELLRRLLDVLDASAVCGRPAPGYRDPEVDVVPLRLAWHDPDGPRLRRRLARSVDVSWTWFMEPIVEARGAREEFGYVRGTCPIQEEVGPRMLNLPCNVPAAWHRALCERVWEAVRECGVSVPVPH